MRKYVFVLPLLLLVACGQPAVKPAVASSKDVQETVVRIVSDQLAVDPARVTPEVSLSQLDADDLDVVELIMALEHQFDVSIPDERIDAKSTKVEGGLWDLTVGDLVELVEEQ